MNTSQIILFGIILALVINLLANMIWKYLPGTSKHLDIYFTLFLIAICVLLIVFNRPAINNELSITPLKVSQLDVSIPYGYIMKACAANRIFEVYAQPTSAMQGIPNEHAQDIILEFDVTNPNYLEARIVDIYIEVIEYHHVEILGIAPIWAGGHMRKFFCNIGPELKVYKAKPLTTEFDYIKLLHGEIEYFGIHVNTITPGVYKLKVSFDYSIGGVVKHQDVGITPEIGFFPSGKQFHQEMSITQL